MAKNYEFFIRRVGLVGLSKSLTNFKGIILLPLYTKILGTSNYGILSIILVTLSILEPFIILGLNSAIVRFLSSQPKEKIVQGLITSIIFVLFTSIIASTVLFFSSDFIASTIIKDPSAVNPIKITSLYLILFSLNSIILGSFRVFGLIKSFSIITIFKTLLEIGLIAYFILSGFGLIGVIFAFIIASTISIIVMLIRIAFYAGFTRPDFSLIKPYIKYGLPLIPILLSIFIFETSDRYVIGFFLGPEKVGIYSAAYGIGIIPIIFSTYLMFMLGPTVFNLYDKGKIAETKNYLSLSWKYLLMLSIPSVFGLFILAKPLLITMTTSIFVSEGIFIIPLVSLSMKHYFNTYLGNNICSNYYFICLFYNCNDNRLVLPSLF